MRTKKATATRIPANEKVKALPAGIKPERIPSDITTLDGKVNAVIELWAVKGYLPDPIVIIKDESENVIAFLSPAAKTGTPTQAARPWVFQVSTALDDFQRGRLFAHHLQSNHGVLRIRGTDHYWGTALKK